MPQHLLRKAILILNSLLRRFKNIQEFSRDEACIFRLAIENNDRDIVLSDGTRIEPGEVSCDCAGVSRGQLLDAPGGGILFLAPSNLTFRGIEIELAI